MSAEKPVFGNPESIKEAKVKPRTKKEVAPTANDPLKVLPTIEKLVVGERKRWDILRGESLDRGTLAREILGIEKDPIHPSLVSKCLRWWGYQQLGYKPIPKDLNAILRLEAGSALHQAFERLLSNMGQVEYHVTHSAQDLADMSGKIDILFRNPKLPPEIGEYQVIELKSVSNYAFKFQLNRQGLRPDLVPTKDIVAPRESDKKQIGLYLKQLDTEGKNVAGANIIYIDRNDLGLKEALIPWDPITQYEIDQFIQQIYEAQELIKQGKLPEATVDSDIPCRYYCDYRHVCDVGRPEAAKRKKPLPKEVKAMAKDYWEKKRLAMEEAGAVQPTLGGDFNREDLTRK